MKTTDELRILVNKIYWQVEGGDIDEAVEELRNLVTCNQDSDKRILDAAGQKGGRRFQNAIARLIDAGVEFPIRESDASLYHGIGPKFVAMMREIQLLK